MEQRQDESLASDSQHMCHTIRVHEISVLPMTPGAGRAGAAYPGGHGVQKEDHFLNSGLTCR